MWVAGPGSYCAWFELIIRFVLSDAITRINCSPFRVPLARLAAAQAVLRESGAQAYVAAGG